MSFTTKNKTSKSMTSSWSTKSLGRPRPKLSSLKFWTLITYGWTQAFHHRHMRSIPKKNKLQSLKIGPVDAEILFDKVWAITWETATVMYSQTAFVDIIVTKAFLQKKAANLKNRTDRCRDIVWMLMMCSIQCRAVWTVSTDIFVPQGPPPSPGNR